MVRMVDNPVMFSAMKSQIMNPIEPPPVGRDTAPEADAFQVALLRQASPERRGRLALILSDATRHLARRAIDQAYPALSEREKDLIFIRVHYGRKVAQTVGSHLGAR